MSPICMVTLTLIAFLKLTLQFDCTLFSKLYTGCFICDCIPSLLNAITTICLDAMMF